MQAINRDVFRGIFIILFLGMALALLAIAFYGWFMVAHRRGTPFVWIAVDDTNAGMASPTNEFRHSSGPCTYLKTMSNSPAVSGNFNAHTPRSRPARGIQPATTRMRFHIAFYTLLFFTLVVGWNAALYL